MAPVPLYGRTFSMKTTDFAWARNRLLERSSSASRMNSEVNTGGGRVGAAVDVNHVESLVTEIAGKDSDCAFHFAPDEDKAVFVFFGERARAVTDIGIMEWVECDDVDVLASSEEGFGCVACFVR